MLAATYVEAYYSSMYERPLNRTESSGSVMRYLAAGLVLSATALTGCAPDSDPANEYSALIACVGPRVMGERHQIVGISQQEADELVDSATELCWDRVSPEALDLEDAQGRIRDNLSVVLSPMIEEDDPIS
jgi:hypothetical protein